MFFNQHEGKIIKISNAMTGDVLANVPMNKGETLTSKDVLTFVKDKKRDLNDKRFTLQLVQNERKLSFNEEIMETCTQLGLIVSPRTPGILKLSDVITKIEVLADVDGRTVLHIEDLDNPGLKFFKMFDY